MKTLGEFIEELMLFRAKYGENIEIQMADDTEPVAELYNEPDEDPFIVIE